MPLAFNQISALPEMSGLPINMSSELGVGVMAASIVMVCSYLAGIDLLLAAGMAIAIAMAVLASRNRLFDASLTSRLGTTSSGVPEIDIDISLPKGTPPVPEEIIQKEVFHVPGNKYNYADAKAICEAYGGRLANYKELEDAYNAGAEWCSYGWSADQMAFYPTQYQTWQGLQKDNGIKHACGRPGINGGYIDNPSIKFGVNCYGHKPIITQEEADLMQSERLVPLTKEQAAENKREKYWRNKLTEILVSPFSPGRWNE